VGKRSANDLIAQLQDPSEELKLDVEGYPLRVTSLSRVLWPASKGVPAITKRDLLLYYAQVGGFMLPHLQDRPLAFVRFPDGLEGKERFFQ
jgi:bifunctional non-homologous end joining protein LigD